MHPRQSDDEGDDSGLIQLRALDHAIESEWHTAKEIFSTFPAVVGGFLYCKLRNEQNYRQRHW